MVYIRMKVRVSTPNYSSMAQVNLPNLAMIGLHAASPACDSARTMDQEVESQYLWSVTRLGVSVMCVKHTIKCPVWVQWAEHGPTVDAWWFVDLRLDSVLNSTHNCIVPPTSWPALGLQDRLVINISRATKDIDVSRRIRNHRIP